MELHPKIQERIREEKHLILLLHKEQLDNLAPQEVILLKDLQNILNILLRIG